MHAETDQRDAALVGLGRQFDAMAAKLDYAIEQAFDIDWSLLEEFGRTRHQGTLVVRPPLSAKYR